MLPPPTLFEVGREMEISKTGEVIPIWKVSVFHANNDPKFTWSCNKAAQILFLDGLWRPSMFHLYLTLQTLWTNANYIMSSVSKDKPVEFWSLNGTQEDQLLE